MKIVWVARQVEPASSFARVYESAEAGALDDTILTSNSSSEMREFVEGDWAQKDDGSYWRMDTVVVDIAGVALTKNILFTLTQESVVSSTRLGMDLTAVAIQRIGGLVDLRGKLPRRDPAERFTRRTPSEFSLYAQWLVIHHSGDVGTPSARQVAEYQTGASSHFPFPEIAYHFYVERDGTVVLCHDLEILTWANGVGSEYAINGVGHYNWRTIAVCIAGARPNDGQVAAVKRIGDGLDATLPQNLTRLGHRDLSNSATECPGSDYKTWIDMV